MKLIRGWHRNVIRSFGLMMLVPGLCHAQDADLVKLPAVQVVASKGDAPPNRVMSVAEGQPALPTCPNGLVPAARIKEMILAEAARHGADAKLAVAISEQESGFGADNNSSQGARGPMQLIAATAATYGVTDICDTAQNIHGGIAYLHDLNIEFGGNVYLMLAAYNAGSERVYKAKGVPAIRETVDYVAKVSNAYFDFPNALQRARKGRVPTPDKTAPAATETALAQPVAEPSSPINKPANDTAPPDKWIGGSVLYVGN